MLRVALVVLMVMVVSPCRADFRVLPGPAPVTQPRSHDVESGRLTFPGPPLYLHRGTRGPAPLVTQDGENVAMREALSKLLAPGWSAALATGVDAYSLSWAGGKPWPEQIETALAEHNLDAYFDWEQRVLTVGPTVRDAWVLKPGSLKASLTEWTERSGWGLSWEVTGYPDIEVERGAVFPLRFTLQDAIAAVVQSYRHEQHINLKADLFTLNTTVRLRCDKGGC